VRYRYTDVVDHAGAPTQAQVGIEYPVDWSVKARTKPLRPHLSTLDALVLAANLAEFHLARVHGLDDGQRRRAWLRRVDIRAAATPFEAGLDRLPVEASVRSTTPLDDQLAGYVSTVDCTVGSMRVRCEIAHERTEDSPQTPATLSDVADGAPLRLFGDGYRDQHQAVQHVVVDVPDERAFAVVRVDAARSRLTDGLEAAYQPSISMIDSFVVSLQLGQVLLYELDGVRRANSNTLWMRRTTLTADSPLRPAGEPVAATTALTDSRLMTVRGATWRTATIAGDVGGVRTSCSVAHELPAAARR
jgi:hypothetical protein